MIKKAGVGAALHAPRISMNDKKQCKLCDAETSYKFSLFLVAGLRGDYFECQTCRMLQSHHLDKLTPQGLIQLANYDPGIDLDAGAAWRQHCLVSRLGQLVRLKILPKADPNFKMLDYGCGTGFLVSYLAHRFRWNTFGYEPYMTPSYAQHKIFADWASCGRGYNLVIASEVFEHFINPREELLRIREILAPDDAFIYVTTGLYVPGQTTESWPYLAPQSGHHVSFYAHQTMQKVKQLIGASAVYQVGADYEWLFTFGESYRSWSKVAQLAIATRLLRRSTRLGILPKIE
jgi:2-polyprenyl-3-methyl-5-hydroxy-6-metoxy-1,4-benzoquinol methylase